MKYLRNLQELKDFLETLTSEQLESPMLYIDNSANDFYGVMGLETLNKEELDEDEFENLMDRAQYTNLKENQLFFKVEYV